MIKQILWFSFLNFLYVSANRIPLVGRRYANPVSVPLRNYRNIVYYGDVALGTPPKKFSMIFDTGSTDVTVLIPGYKKICNKPLTKDECFARNPAKFDPSASRTYEKTDGTFAQEFADQSKRRGYLATDVLEIGEENSKIRVRIPVGMATETTDWFSKADGIFGLGLNMASSFVPKIITPFECMVSQADIPPRFSFYAKKGEKESDDIYGELYLGGYNPANMVSSNDRDTVTVPVIKTNNFYYHWQFNLDGIIVGNNVIQLKGKDIDGDGIPGTIAIPDTGCGTILTPLPVMNLLLGYIFSTEISQKIYAQRTFPCASLPANLPQIAFIVNGKPLTVGPEDYIIFNDGIICQAKLSASGSVSEVILGLPFLQKYYTMFDYENKELNFAEAKQPARKSEQYYKK